MGLGCTLLEALLLFQHLGSLSQEKKTVNLAYARITHKSLQITNAGKGVEKRKSSTL